MHVTVDTETSNTTIWVHSEADVGVKVGGGGLEPEAVARVGVKSNFREDGNPLNGCPLFVCAGSGVGGGLLVTLNRDER